MPSALLFIFWSAFTVGFTGAVAPGPLLTRTISEVMRRGFLAGPAIVLGHAILELVLLVVVMSGLDDWIRKDIPMITLGLAGGALLVAMGIHMALTAKRATATAISPPTPGRDNPMGGPVLAGILMSVSNPYWTLWWATTGLYMIGQSLTAGMTGLVVFYFGHILADLVWYTAVATAVASGRRICPPKVYQTLLVVCGLAVTGLGFHFAADALVHLTSISQSPV